MTTLYVTTQGATVYKHSGQIFVCKKSDILQNLPETLVKQIILIGNINLTTPLVAFCLEKQIEVVFLSQGGKFRGRLNGEASRSVELRRRQYELAADAEFCLRQARAVVAGKINNQIALARRQNQNLAAERETETLRKLLEKAGRATSPEILLGVEGSASAVYFQMFGKWISAPWTFQGRAAHPPADEVNALLSLSYTLVYNRITTHLNMIGLDPFLGFFHQPRNGHAALASDLVEEFRAPFADALVLKLIRRKQIKPEDFERAGNGFHLKPEASKIFFREFEEKMSSRRMSAVHENLNLTYAQIIKRQASHFARVVGGEKPNYEPFRLR